MTTNPTGLAEEAWREAYEAAFPNRLPPDHEDYNLEVQRYHEHGFRAGFLATQARHEAEVAELAEGLRKAADFIEALGDNICRNDVDMLLDKSPSPSIAVEEARALVSAHDAK